MHAGSDHHHDSEVFLQLGGLDPRVSPDEFTCQLVLQHALNLQEGPKREVQRISHLCAGLVLNKLLVVASHHLDGTLATFKRSTTIR